MNVASNAGASLTNSVTASGGGATNPASATDVTGVNPKAAAPTVSVLLGNGDGTFQPQQSYAIGNNPAAVAVADIDGDGNADVIVINHEDGSVSVLLGR